MSAPMAWLATTISTIRMTPKMAQAECTMSVARFMFLSDREHIALSRNTRFAKRCLGEALFEARVLMAQHLWSDVHYFQGRAMEVAEVLLLSDFERKRAEIRHSRVVAEFAYTLRRLHRNGDLHRLQAAVSALYDRLDLLNEKQALMKPLQGVLSASDDMVALRLGGRPLKSGRELRQTTWIQ